MGKLQPLTQLAAKTDLVLYEGVTTSDGTTLTIIDSALVGVNDFLTDVTIIIQSGDCRRETRDISSFTNVTGTITVGTAFSAQIVSGVTFAITARMSADVEVAALQADVTIIKADTQTIEDSTLKASPTSGSMARFIASGGTALGTQLPDSKSLYDVVVIDRLSGTETISSYDLPDDLVENTAIEIVTGSRQKLESIWLDFVNLVQNVTIKVYHQIDGTNYRQYDTYYWVTTDEDGVLIKNLTINNDWKLTITNAVAQGAIKAIPYNIIKTQME